MAAYDTDGLWQHSGQLMDRDDLPVDSDLRERHFEWCCWYEDSNPEKGWRKFDVRAFAAEGLEIAKAIKAQLPDWTVIYYDAARARAVWPLNVEYEVT